MVLPWVIGNEFYVNMATQVLIYALFALSINMMLGYGGMTSLGHAAYLGIAGYACIIATTAGYGQLTAAIFALVVSTVSAAFFGVLSLRAPGLGFIMITLALGQIVWGVAYRANDLTGGDNGIRHPARPMPFGLDIRDAPSFYYFTLAVFAIALFCIWRFSRSPFGASLMGARDQPRRMRMLGHNVWRVRLITFVMAGFWASVASLLYVYYNLFLSPHAISLQQSAEILLMAILGGASSLTGPIVGAVVITLIKNVVSSYVERWNTLLGVIFVVTIVFMPYGLVPGCRQLWERLRNRKKPKESTKATQDAALASVASGQRGHSSEARTHGASEDASRGADARERADVERADDTRPEPGSPARDASEPAQ
jgi:branched-chain amino acid transport system permease protein